jgi:hypothetical protein
MAAAMQGSAEFFAPETRMVPPERIAAANDELIHNRGNLAVDLGSRGNKDLAVLKDVRDNARAKLVAALAHRSRQAIHQADAN